MIHFGPCGDLQVLVESASAGRTARAPRCLDSPCASILAELGELNRESAPLAAGAFWKDLTRSTGELPDDPGRGLLARGMRTVESLVGRDAVPLCFSHGDFAPWNMVRVDGQILLFDWEYASRAMPPGFDAVHFLVQTGALLEGRSPAAIARDLLESDVLRRVAGASDGLFLPLLLLALMGQLKDCARGERGDFASLQRLSMILQLFLSGEAARA